MTDKYEPFTILLNDDGTCSEEACCNGELVMFVGKTNGAVDSRYCVQTDDVLKIADAIRACRADA